MKEKERKVPKKNKEGSRKGVEKGPAPFLIDQKFDLNLTARFLQCTFFVL